MWLYHMTGIYVQCTVHVHVYIHACMALPYDRNIGVHYTM